MEPEAAWGLNYLCLSCLYGFVFNHSTEPFGLPALGFWSKSQPDTYLTNTTQVNAVGYSFFVPSSQMYVLREHLIWLLYSNIQKIEILLLVIQKDNCDQQMFFYITNEQMNTACSRFQGV